MAYLQAERLDKGSASVSQLSCVLGAFYSLSISRCMSIMTRSAVTAMADLSSFILSHFDL